MCVVHCVATVVLVSLLSTAGNFLANPAFHEFGLVGAIAIGAVALRQGYAAHGALRPALVGGVGLALMATGLVVPDGLAEVATTIAGVSILAIGHLLNARAHA